MSTPKAFLCAMNSFQGDWIPEEIARSVPSKLSDNLALDKLASCLYYYNNLAVSIFQSHMGDILKYYWIEKNFAEFHNSMLFILLSQLPSSLFEFSSSYNLHNPLSLQLFLLLSYQDSPCQTSDTLETSSCKSDVKESRQIQSMCGQGLCFLLQLL